MTGQFELDGKIYNLKLGKSFDNAGGEAAFHTIRYDFKPASVDSSKDAVLEIDEGSCVTVTVPHVEGSGMSHTIFKGNRKSSQKECVLIINHDTGDVVLEKLNNFMQVKSTRRSTKGSSGNIKQKQDSPSQSAAVQAKSEPLMNADPGPSLGPGPDLGLDLDRMCEALSASSTSDSDTAEDSGDDDGEHEERVSSANDKISRKPGYHSILSHDLRLSESDSD